MESSSILVSRLQIIKNLNLFYILPYFTIRELIILSRVCKFFFNLIKQLRILWTYELETIAKKWNFVIDKIDLNRLFANKIKRRYYLENSEYEMRMITKESVKCLISSLSTYNQNQEAKIVNFYNTMCGEKILYFKFSDKYNLEFKLTQLNPGKYKLFIRAAIESNGKFLQLINVFAKSNLYEKKLYVGEFPDANQIKIWSKTLKEKFGLLTSDLTDIFITQIELSKNIYDSKYDLIVKLEMVKNTGYYSIRGWYLDGIVLEYL